MPGTERTPNVVEVCTQILDGTYGSLVQSFGILLLVIFFNFIIKNLILKLKDKFKKEEKIWKYSLVCALYKPLSYYIWFFAIIASFDIIVFHLFAIHIVDTHILLTVSGVLALGWFLLRWNHEVISYMQELSAKKQIDISPARLDLMSKLATIGIMVFIMFLLMETTGRNWQTLIAFGGIGGLALAFASQQVISNFFGGLMIYLTHPFTVGEWVNLPERKIEGTIEDIGWYMTRVRSFDKRPIYIPNSIFTQTIVITPSRMSHQRINEKIGIRYHDMPVLKKIIDDIQLMLLHHPKVDKQQKTETFFSSFGRTSADIEISAFVLSTYLNEFNLIKQDIFFKIADIIMRHNAQIASSTSIIEIPSSISLQGPSLVPGSAAANLHMHKT